MNDFQNLMTAGSELHRAHSGQWMTHRPLVGRNQRVLGSIVEQVVVDREFEGTVVQCIEGILLLLPSELTTPVARLSKFVSETETWNFDDKKNYDRSGVYHRIPIYRTLPVRKGPSEDYKRNDIGT